MVAGVYLITNKINGHMYVGGSIDIKNRFRQHKRGEDADTQIIDKAIIKYGKENFTYQIITELPADWKIIGEHEKYWINFYNTFKNKNHYNLTEGGEGISGWTHTEETRKKISENHADNSGENHPMWKKHHSEETKQKIREANTGNTHSEEQRKRISNTRSQKYNTTGYYRVSKRTDSGCKQGFIYIYLYYDINGKRHGISSVSLEKLEKRVKNNGLTWKIIDEEKALKTLNEV